MPQDHALGAEGEVDFADLWVILRGVKTKIHLFTFRLSASGRSVHRAFGTQGQEAFLEGHVYAFDRLGGVPVRHVRYDNLKAAVSRVLTGRNRLGVGPVGGVPLPLRLRRLLLPARRRRRAREGRGGG